MRSSPARLLACQHMHKRRLCLHQRRTLHGIEITQFNLVTRQLAMYRPVWSATCASRITAAALGLPPLPPLPPWFKRPASRAPKSIHAGVQISGRIADGLLRPLGAAECWVALTSPLRRSSVV